MSSLEAAEQYKWRFFQHRVCMSKESCPRTSGSAHYIRCHSSCNKHCPCYPFPCSSRHKTQYNPPRCRNQSGTRRSGTVGWTARWRPSRRHLRRIRWRSCREGRTQAAGKLRRATQCSRKGYRCTSDRRQRRRCWRRCSSTHARRRGSCDWHSRGCASS